jgi:hypothetical protein
MKPPENALANDETISAQVSMGAILLKQRI